NHSLQKQELFRALKKRSPYLPIPPDRCDEMRPADWFGKQAMDLPFMRSDQVLLVREERDRVLWLAVGYETPSELAGTEPGDRGYYGPQRDNGFIWADENKELKAVIEALPFALEELIGADISSRRIEAFLAGNEALPEGEARRIERLLTGSRLVLFPRTSAAFSSVYNCMSHGWDVRLTVEIVGEARQSSPYRVFACDSYTGGLFVLAVRASSKADNPKLNEYLKAGRVRVGAPAFAAITYFLENLVVDRPLTNTAVVIEAIEAMLDACPEWAE
ncbi:TPA: hypothetical protein ACG1SX_005794, partial [Pseudomonas aeruginosa]